MTALAPGQVFLSGTGGRGRESCSGKLLSLWFIVARKRLPTPLPSLVQTAVRETYRIVGQELITHDDYTSGRRFDDAVCHSFYPIDLHDRHGVVPKPLAPGTVATVPLGALVPRGSRHLLVAGRSISSDRLANSALRVQASCMAMGQAAGAAAALAVRNGVTPAAVDLSELHDLLRQHDAIVPD